MKNSKELLGVDKKEEIEVLKKYLKKKYNCHLIILYGLLSDGRETLKINSGLEEAKRLVEFIVK